MYSYRCEKGQQRRAFIVGRCIELLALHATGARVVRSLFVEFEFQISGGSYTGTSIYANFVFSSRVHQKMAPLLMYGYV